MDAVTFNAIVSRALKGQARRRRDGKPRRESIDPLLDGFADIRDENIRLATHLDEFKLELAASREEVIRLGEFCELNETQINERDKRVVELEGIVAERDKRVVELEGIVARLSKTEGGYADAYSEDTELISKAAV